jgi:Protein of unknown function DUF72
MTAAVRLGTCSWADEGLLKTWYPRGVSTAQARLRYYAERFDVVEVDSPYYALPDPDVTRRWAEQSSGLVTASRPRPAASASPRATISGPTWWSRAATSSVPRRLELDSLLAQLCSC